MISVPAEKLFELFLRSIRNGEEGLFWPILNDSVTIFGSGGSRTMEKEWEKEQIPKIAKEILLELNCDPRILECMHSLVGKLKIKP